MYLYLLITYPTSAIVLWLLMKHGVPFSLAIVFVAGISVMITMRFMEDLLHQEFGTERMGTGFADGVQELKEYSILLLTVVLSPLYHLLAIAKTMYQFIFLFAGSRTVHEAIRLFLPTFYDLKLLFTNHHQDDELRPSLSTEHVEQDTLLFLAAMNKIISSIVQLCGSVVLLVLVKGFCMHPPHFLREVMAHIEHQYIEFLRHHHYRHHHHHQHHQHHPD